MPATRATRERGPNRAEGIFSPTPRTDEGGAAVSQYVGPGLAEPILRADMAFTPKDKTNMWRRNTSGMYEHIPKYIGGYQIITQT